MLGQLLAYAASRATSDAVEGISRRIVWSVAGGVVLVLGLVFGVIALFMYLQARMTPIEAAVAIAAGCVIVALVCFSIPGIVNAIARARHRQQDPVTETVAAVQEETREAVDYFGPLKVMASAFMVGFGAARQLRR
jgi:hypothetical protein